MGRTSPADRLAGRRLVTGAPGNQVGAGGVN